jgi:hypothetical protein
MKTLPYGLIVIMLFTNLFSMHAKSATGATEQYPYEVLHNFDQFELRLYQGAIFARTHIDAETYRRGSGNGFRTLASYIFGNNDREESIAMTAPVVMSWEDGMTMEFMMPSAFTMETLPSPGDPGIEIYEKPSVVMAGLSFGGWANDRRIAQKIEELSALLDAHGIAHTGHFQYFGYNPPYQVSNRRNDIVVEITGLAK